MLPSYVKDQTQPLHEVIVNISNVTDFKQQHIVVIFSEFVCL